MSTQQAPTFSTASATEVMRHACAEVGLDLEGAELLRLGENAIFKVNGGEPMVVRIARGPAFRESAEKEVAVAGWLADEGIRAARLWSGQQDQPLDVEGYPVTFWEYIDGRRGGPDDIVALAEVLRDLHSRPIPTGIALPDEDILGRVVPRIESAPIPDDDRRFLLDLADELKHAVAELSYSLTPAVTHGDAHVQNLMIVGDQTVLIDFERVAVGQPEWDLAMTATEYVTARWWTGGQYVAFAETYGFDVRDLSGFAVLRRTHELKMTTWLMQNVNESPGIRAEYGKRLDALRAGVGLNAWRTF